MPLEGCVTDISKLPVRNCFFLGCWDGFEAYQGSDSFEWAVYFNQFATGVMLWGICIYNLFLYRQERLKAKESGPNDYLLSEKEKQKQTPITDASATRTTGKPTQRLPFPWMRLNIALYCFTTGFFGVFRAVYQLAKPLFLGAALHNLSEWCFMSFIFYQRPLDIRYAFIFSLFFIWMVLILVVAIPNSPWDALLVQVTGIALDFCLPMMYTILLIQARAQRDQSAVKMWLLAVIATYTHLFGTILPLVVENFVVGQDQTFSSIMEGLIGFSVPVTMVLYTEWCTMYQTKVAVFAETPDYLVVKRPEAVLKCAAAQCCCKGQFLLFVFWFSTATFLGLIPTTITPALMSLCPVDGDNEAVTYSSTGVCDDGAFYGHSIGVVHEGMEDAFESLVLHDYGLIDAALEFPGNDFYYVIRSNQNSSRYLWFEQWDNLSAVTDWVYNGLPSKVFSDPEVVAMLEGGALEFGSMSGYTRRTPCEKRQSDEGHMSTDDHVDL